jgi:putative ABC transport system permease protein
MFINSFKIALRNLFKRKGYTLLNMLGLAIGICCCLLIFQYVSFERSYDTFQTASPQIFRIRLDQYKQGTVQWKSATSYPGIAPALKRDYPEVENYCRLIDWNGIFASAQTNIKFSETKGYYADPSAINMLSVQLVKGNAAKALEAPDQVVISETMAKKYFGNEDAVGKQLQVRAGSAPANLSYVVTGVFKDYPTNSHLIINYLVSWATLEEELRLSGDTTNAVNTSFSWYDFYSYIQLKQGADHESFEAKLQAFCDKYINSKEWNKTNNVKNSIALIPLSDIHLYSNYNQEAEVNGNGQAVSFMFMIAFLIMGIAWINYINLATARSVERAKEVGVRKVLGASRNDLIRQFMMESALLNLTALVIGIVAALSLSPVFNSMMGRDVYAAFNLSSKYTLIFAGIFIFGTLLSGLYPAFVLSGYKPVTVLKGAFKNTSGGLALRKSLIVLQFSVSVILIAGTIIVYQQVNYMRNQKLGANIDQTLVVDGAQSMNDSLYKNIYQSFKNEILKLPAVKSMTASTTVMGQEIYWTRGVKPLQSSATSTTLYLLGIDYDFIPQYQLHLAAGRNFSKDFPVDANRRSAILNEEAVKAMGFKNAEDAIGKKILVNDTLTIEGVVQGFHQLGLQKPIDPQLILLRPDVRNEYSIKLQSENMQQNIAAVQKLWDKFFPNDPFSYFFLDDLYAKQYASDQQFGKMFTLFAFLAILIACFGLLGLSSYNILQRTKEIGIRKVLGASIQNVLYMLSKDFLTLVAVAFVVAIPLAWLIMHSWLQNYAYRININWWVFLVAGMIAVLIAVITISFQAVKAAIANPVKSLRTE